MQLENINIGDPVVYIPKHLLHGEKKEMVKDENLGIVKSKNDSYVFVSYKGNGGRGIATNAEDLYSLSARPDLLERLGIEIKPINKLYEQYIKEKEFFNAENTFI